MIGSVPLWCVLFVILGGAALLVIVLAVLVDRDSEGKQ